MIIGGLILDLSHQQIEGGIGENQSQYVERGGQLEAARHVDDALEYLFHNNDYSCNVRF